VSRPPLLGGITPLPESPAEHSLGRFTQLPAQPTQDALSSLVDNRYADLQVVKREAKKRDVLAFVLGMQPGDLVLTVMAASCAWVAWATGRPPSSRSAARPCSPDRSPGPRTTHLQ